MGYIKKKIINSQGFRIFEIIYYTIISFILALIVGNILNDDDYMPYCFKSYNFENTKMKILFKDIIIDISIYVIILFYIKKLIKRIPFLFYKKHKEETNIGIGIGISIVLYKALSTVFEKINALNKKFKELLTITPMFGKIQGISLKKTKSMI